jgi:WhiB family redox-sensing transcriptional regulator
VRSDDILSIERFISNLSERSWIQEAACRGMNTDIFFPERGDRQTIALAREVCNECPVTAQCRDYGMRERIGIWGGTTEFNRRKMRSGLSTGKSQNA